MTATGMPLRGDRILRYVVAFCPRCHEAEPDRPVEDVERLSGYLSEADGHVWLVRGCRMHGKVVTLYDESPEILAYLEQWTAPTKRHTPDTSGNFDPVPKAYLRGLGEMQTQHTCILLEDITETCNLRCPTCFADSSPQLSGVAPVESVLANIDQRLAREGGRLDVLMLSGGEPTIYPDFEELLDGVLERDIARILVNTNGIAIARDDRVFRAIASRSERVEVYLQFDGFKRSSHMYHRHADLRALKEEAIARLSDARVFTTLTMTAALGVNDDEIGAVVLKTLETPYIGGTCIQPQFGSGRSDAIDPLDRLTHTGVLARLGPQTDGLVTWRDLTALPCSHPHCASVGYMIRTDAGEWRSLTSLIGHDTLKQHLGLVSNRVVDPELSAQLGVLLREALLGLLSEQSSLTHPTITDLFKTVCDSCDLGIGTLVRVLGKRIANRHALRDEFARRVKRITIKPFMDINTMLEERLLQCCVHVGTESDEQHQCAPFCAAQAWKGLADMKVAAVAGRETKQLPILLSSP